MENLGNDFIFINKKISKEKIIILCDRYSGIGADGVIIVSKDKSFMEIYNSDGSEANMCGNALLCFGKLHPELNSVETKSGCNFFEMDNEEVIVNMGIPSIVKGFPKKFQNIPINVVNIGNTHVIALVEDVDMFDLEYFAKSIQHYINANVNIVSNVTKKSFRIRTYEYGANETNACGSGITSTFFVLNKLGLIESSCEAYALGGTMKVYKIKEDIFLKSKPKLVYKGVINI